jgi:predicted ribosomally synthesized peptide with nif11-like leader
MSEEQLKAFLDALQGDTALQERLKAAADTDAVVALAREAGFAISKAEMLKVHGVQQTWELSDEELESAAGGTGCGDVQPGALAYTVCMNASSPQVAPAGFCTR